jgi:hypothetical protein
MAHKHLSQALKTGQRVSSTTIERLRKEIERQLQQTPSASDIPTHHLRSRRDGQQETVSSN